MFIRIMRGAMFLSRKYWSWYVGEFVLSSLFTIFLNYIFSLCFVYPYFDLYTVPSKIYDVPSNLYTVPSK